MSHVFLYAIHPSLLWSSSGSLSFRVETQGPLRYWLFLTPDNMAIPSKSHFPHLLHNRCYSHGLSDILILCLVPSGQPYFIFKILAILSHLIIRISVPACLCLLVTGQHSAPYRATGRRTVLFIFALRCLGMLLSQRTPVTWRHFSQAVLTRDLTSGRLSPSAKRVEPRYLNWVAFFSSIPLILMVSLVWGGGWVTFYVLRLVNVKP